MRKPHLETTWVTADTTRDGVVPYRYDQYLVPGLPDDFGEMYAEIGAWVRNDLDMYDHNIIKIFCGHDGVWRVVVRYPFHILGYSDIAH